MEKIDKISLGESKFDSLTCIRQSDVLEIYRSQTGEETLSVDEMDIFYEWYYDNFDNLLKN